jgi:hypothetical protein
MPEDLKRENKDIAALKINLNITKGFLDLVKKIDALPDMKKTTYTQIRSLYQAVSKGRDSDTMEKVFEEFFGPPAKPAGKSLPLRLRFNPSIKYLDGVREDQILFIKKVKAGFYYGALWPWRRDPMQITVHLGFCSHRMSEKDFKKLEELVKSKALHERVFEEFDSKIKGQIQGISLASFLHMAAMEKMSCTLRVQSGDKLGYLYLLDGDLINAETGLLQKEKAAYQIIGWEKTTIEIEKSGAKTENEINQSVVQILMEALKLKDDKAFRQIEPSVDENGVITLPPELEVLVRGDRQPLEKKPASKKRDPKKIAVTAAVALLIVGLGAGLTMRWIASQRIKDDYRQVLAAVESQRNLSVKVNMLRNFVNSHDPGKFTEDAEEKIKKIRAHIEEQDFRTTLAATDKLRANEDYDNALAGCRAYIKKHPTGIHAVKMNQIISEILLLADEKDYERLVKPSYGDILEKASAYMQYINKHPEGRHRDEVNRLISDMAGPYHLAFNRQLSECYNQEDWGKCVQLCDTFLGIYPSHTRAPEIKKYQTAFRVKQKEKRTLESLAAKAEQAGKNYKAALQVYLDYLDSNPDASLKTEILKRITWLKKLDEQERLRQERKKMALLLQDLKGRFVDNQDGTVKDTRTGLTWNMLDSSIERRKCLNYEDALQYVKELRVGGHKGWRLPTESELIGIYGRKPSFPPSHARWFWTSKTYSRYSDGWQTMVTIVRPQTADENKKKEEADARECGAVHAVRP